MRHNDETPSDKEKRERRVGRERGRDRESERGRASEREKRERERESPLPHIHWPLGSNPFSLYKLVIITARKSCTESTFKRFFALTASTPANPRS